MKAPRLALWLLNTCGCGPSIAALTGDLIEECERGRSRAWFWRQALAAIVISFVQVIRDNKLAALRASVAIYVLLWMSARLVVMVIPLVMAAADGYMPAPTVLAPGARVPWDALHRSWLAMLLLTPGAVLAGWVVTMTHGVVGRPMVCLAAVVWCATASVPVALGSSYAHDGGWMLSQILWLLTMFSPTFVPVALLAGGAFGKRRGVALA